MKTIHLLPLVGVDSIKLGMPRTEVQRILGPCSASFKKSPLSAHPTDAWLNNGFQVFYSGGEPRIEYIELSRGSGFEVELFGLPVFSTEASSLVEHIERQAALDRTNPELGYSYIFPSIELSFWRPTVGEPESLLFSTVGIGVNGYYSGA